MLNFLKRTSNAGSADFKPVYKIVEDSVDILSRIHQKLLRLSEQDYLARFDYEHEGDWEMSQVERLVELHNVYPPLTRRDYVLRQFAIFKGWSLAYLGVYLAEQARLEFEGIMNSDLKLQTSWKIRVVFETFLQLMDMPEEEFIKKREVHVSDRNPQALNLKIHEIGESKLMSPITKVVWRWNMNFRTSVYDDLTFHCNKVINLVKKVESFLIYQSEMEG